MSALTHVRGRSRSGIGRFRQGASQPSDETSEGDVGYLSACDDHVVNSWFEFDGAGRAPKSSLDTVAGDRVSASLRDQQPKSRSAGLPWRAHHDDSTLAAAGPVGEDSTKVLGVSEGFVATCGARH